MCVPREVVWIQLIVENHVEDPRLGHSTLSYNIACASPRLSTTAAIVASLLAGVHTARGRPVFTNALGIKLLCHGDVAAVAETH
jgi:hypothetical protein